MEYGIKFDSNNKEKKTDQNFLFYRMFCGIFLVQPAVNGGFKSGVSKLFSPRATYRKNKRRAVPLTRGISYHKLSYKIAKSINCGIDT